MAEFQDHEGNGTAVEEFYAEDNGGHSGEIENQLDSDRIRDRDVEKNKKRSRAKDTDRDHELHHKSRRRMNRSSERKDDDDYSLEHDKKRVSGFNMAPPASAMVAAVTGKVPPPPPTLPGARMFPLPTGLATRHARRVYAGGFPLLHTKQSVATSVGRMAGRMCGELTPKRIPSIESMRAVRSTCKRERRILLSIGRRGRMTRGGKKKVGRRTKRTSMCDLPWDLVAQEILTRVPITSLKAVRSTCKLWDALSKDCIFGKAAAAPQVLGFIKKNSKVCSVRFQLSRGSNKDKEDEEDLLDLSIKQVDLLDQFEISQVLHCDGLLLCVADDYSRLLMWNPYLGQTQWIEFTTVFDSEDCYALGYDVNRNHKILRFYDSRGVAERRFEIYDFSSNSWRFLKVDPDWITESHHVGVSLKGNAYFYAQEFPRTDEDKAFLLCFDFTTERFGPRLPLPFHSDCEDSVALSCLKEEKLVVLDQEARVDYSSGNIVQIWVTTAIEPNYVSWSQFLRVEIKPYALTTLTGVEFCDYFGGGSFFIDEEEKIAVVFDFDGYSLEVGNDNKYHTALVMGEGGYLKSVSLGAHKHEVSYLGCSSSYHPSLVQLNQPQKGKEYN